MFSTEGESRGLREKRGSRGRGRKGSDEDSPRKKKIKNRYFWWFRQAKGLLDGMDRWIFIRPENPLVLIQITIGSLICPLCNHVSF